MRKILLVVVVALGLFASALPAQAAALEWKDAEGDALFAGVPVPSEPSLDVIKVRMEVVKDNLVWTASIQKIGASNPPGSTGVGFQYSFKYGEVSATLHIYDDVLIGKATEFRAAATGASTATIPCGRCIGVIDRKNSKIVLTTPLSGLYAAIRTVDKKSPPFTPGAKIEGLTLATRRLYSVGQPGAYGSYPVASDTSAPTGNSPFVF